LATSAVRKTDNALLELKNLVLNEKKKHKIGKLAILITEPKM
jgi:hypothetical protein